MSSFFGGSKSFCCLTVSSCCVLLCLGRNPGNVYVQQKENRSPDARKDLHLQQA
jgi:hypothetical protein